MTIKENFSALVSKERTGSTDRNKERIKDRAMLRESQKIAMKVLRKLDESGWSQKNLAKAMEVSPQQISKIVRGKENLTLETQIKLQSILDIPILASYYENKMKAMETSVLTIEKRVEKIAVQVSRLTTNYQSTRTIKIEPRAYSQASYQLAG